VEKMAVLLRKLKSLIEIVSTVRNWFSVILLDAGLKKNIVVVFRNGITVEIPDKSTRHIIYYLGKISLCCPILHNTNGKCKMFLGNTEVAFQLNDENSIYRAYILSCLCKELKIKFFHERSFCEFYFKGRKVIYFFSLEDFSSIFNLYVTFIRERDTYGALDVRNKVVADVGASFGDSAIFFALKGARKVYAYEPIPWVAKILEKNVRLNNLSDVVKIYPYAVSLNEGKATLIVPKNKTEGASLYYDDKKFHIAEKRERELKLMHITVEKTTPPLDADVAKIDCEGCEYDIIKFLKDRIYDEIVMEYHSDYRPLTKKLMELGYRVRVLKKVSSIHGIIYAYDPDKKSSATIRARLRKTIEPMI